MDSNCKLITSARAMRVNHDYYNQPKQPVTSYAKHLLTDKKSFIMLIAHIQNVYSFTCLIRGIYELMSDFTTTSGKQFCTENGQGIWKYIENITH